MSTKRFTLTYFGGPLIIAILASLMQVIDQLLAGNTVLGQLFPNGAGWIAFQAWAVYFLGGCTPKGGLKGFISYFAGIAVSIVIFKWAAVIGGFWSVPIVLLPTVLVAISLEKFEMTSYVPALFVGAGAYFCIMSYIAPQPGPFQGNFYAYAAGELFYCFFGLLWGFLTIVIRGAFDKKFNS